MKLNVMKVKMVGLGGLTVKLALFVLLVVLHNTPSNAQVIENELETTLPVVSISLESTNYVIDEGDPIVVRVVVSPKPATGDSLDVTLAVTETGVFKGYFVVREPATMVTVSDTGIAFKTLSTTLISEQTGNGEITIRVVEGIEYSGVEPPNNRIIVTVIDTHTPLISVVSQSKLPILEGHVAEFNITTTVEKNMPILVNLQTRQSGNFVLWGVSDKITIGPNQNSATYRIVTLDDEVAEEDGSVTVRVLDGTRYNVNTDSYVATVSVKDDDPETHIGGQPVKYSVSSAVIEKILLKIPPHPNSDNPNSILSTEVADLPVVSIRALEESVNEGSLIIFKVETSIDVADDIIVNLSVEETEDYVDELAFYSVRIIADSSESTFSVPTVDDDLAENYGIVTAKVISGVGYVPNPDKNQVSVGVRDDNDWKRRRDLIAHASGEVLSEFLASVGGRSLDLAARRNARRYSSNGLTTFEMGGQSELKKFIEKGGNSVNGGTLDWQAILGTSKFEFGLFHDENSPNTFAVWGAGDLQDFSKEGANRQFYWDGSMFTGFAGMDSRLNKAMIAGLAAAVIDSEADYDTYEMGTFQFQNKANVLYPYFGITSEDEDYQFQTILGVGQGEITVQQENGISETLNSRIYMLAASGENQLFVSESCLQDRQCELKLKGSTWLVSQSQMESGNIFEVIDTHAHHFAINAVGRHVFEIANGSEMVQNTLVGVRGNGKANQSTIGLEFGNGILKKFANGLFVESENSILVSQKFETDQWKHFISLNYDYGSDRKGLQVEATKNWSQSIPDDDFSLWGRNPVNQTSFGDSLESQNSFKSEIGFGLFLGIDQKLLTPYVNVDLDALANSYRAGVRIESTSAANYVMDAYIQQSDKIETSNHQFKLKGRIGW